MPPEEKSRVEFGDYKGNPTITLDADSKWPFSFGVKKAKLILEHMDDIRDFVQANEGE